MNSVRSSLITAFLLSTSALAQVPASAPPAVPTQPKSELQQLVDKQFGPDFEVVSESPMAHIKGSRLDAVSAKSWQPLLVGDLDGDGVPDAVIIARNKNATIGAGAYNYKVIDAYNGYFGYGDPKVTVDLNNDDPVHNLLLLVIHGKDKDGWKADAPKAKFVLINVPFEAVALARSTLKKKDVDAIRVEESDTVSSLLFWDGKHYKYSPGGGSTDW